MAERNIVQNLIAGLGQSQADRDLPALDPASAPLHTLDAAQLLLQAQRLAQHIRFHDGVEGSNLDWRPFYPVNDTDIARALLAHTEGQLGPHLALAAAFAQLFDQHPRRLVNGFGARHLDTQWRTLLGFNSRPAQPDRAHVIVELKKAAAGAVGPPALGSVLGTALGSAPAAAAPPPPAISFGPDRVLLAGKDATGVERHYSPVRETFISTARVAALRALHRDSSGRVSAATQADSADGLGTPLPPANTAWPPFGPATGHAWPQADVGFAVASPLLALAEGHRQVELLVSLQDPLPATLLPRLAALFECVYTTPQGWSAPLPAAVRAQGAQALLCTLALPPQAAPCVACSPALHGPAFNTQAPVLQWRLREGASLSGLDGLAVASVSLSVQVQGISQGLQLESDAGALSPKRAFQPFGAQPVVGSRLVVGCAEALAKPLADVQLHLAWQAAPSPLQAWYAGYRNQARLANGVSATLVCTDGSGRSTRRALDLMARDASGVSVLSPTAPPPGAEHSAWSGEPLAGLVERLAGPAARGHAQSLQRRYGTVLAQGARGSAQALRPGTISVQLNEDFLHADHRRETVENALAGNTTVLNEPYTPTVQTVSLSYRSHSVTVPLAPAADEASDAARFAEAAVQWFHVGPFGARREHPFLRRQLPFLGSTQVPLLPPWHDEGELLIGLTQAQAGDALSLLLQVAEGTADPELAPAAVQWSVLAGEHWRALGADDIALDATQGLLRSGIVALALPRETTAQSTWMPGGLTWLRASVAARSRACCALRAVRAQAVEVQFSDRGNDPLHAATPLPAGSLNKLQRPDAAIKSLQQPFDSMGGRVAEDEAALRRRASERLRHRGRALCAWDMERLVLEAFPQLHRVKCLPHARPGQWLAPGHVTVVVVPHLHSAAAGTNPLRPRADLGTLEAVRAHLAARGPMGTGLTVKNPHFEALRLHFKLKLKPGFAFNPHRQRLNDLLVATLTPWASYAAAPLLAPGTVPAEPAISFGGRVLRSVLLALVEAQPYVDFVTDFRLQPVAEDGSAGPDAAEHRATRPDAILVSAPQHAIGEVL